MIDPCFWMVLSDNSNYTIVRHRTLEIAKGEANRLAAANPGIRFFVLQSIGAAVRTDPVSWVEHDTIPF